MRTHDFEPGVQRRGWQHVASSRVELQHSEMQLFPSLSSWMKALMRSQSGSGARVTRLEPPLFRVLLLRCLRLPLPFSQRLCRCGRLIDALGNHRAARAQAGVLWGCGCALESAAARICREASARVTTLVSALHRDGAAHCGPAKSSEPMACVCHLAKATAICEPLLMRKRVEQAWRL